MTDKELACLALISGNEGKWSWYQLHRAFSLSKLDSSDLMEVISKLEHEGLLLIKRPAESPVDLYWLTDKARAKLAEVREQVRRNPAGEE